MRATKRQHGTEDGAPAIPPGIETAPDQLPKPNGRQPEEPGFFERPHQIAPEDWQAGFKVYVYRTWPIIDRRDNEHFLAKIGELFDEDYLLRHFGSGKYVLRLNDSRGKTLASKTVSLHNPSFPPKVSPDEVVESDPRNEVYFKVWALAKATEDGQPHPNGADSTSAAAINELGDIARTLLAQQKDSRPAGKESALDPAVVNLWQETAKQRDALAEKVATLAGGAHSADPLAVLDRVLGAVEKMNRSQAPAAQQKGAVEQLQEMVSLVASLRETFAPEEPAAVATPVEGGSIWQTLISAFAPVVGQLAAPIGQAIATKMMSPDAGTASAPANGRPGMPHITTAPTAKTGSASAQIPGMALWVRIPQL